MAAGAEPGSLAVIAPMQTRTTILPAVFREALENIGMVAIDEWWAFLDEEGQALRPKMVLESSDIPSFIPDEMMAGVVPHHFLTCSGVRLQVAEEHAAEAQKIIAEAR